MTTAIINSRIRLTIEEMQQIANERGGICISETYINARTKLKWQCAKGHVWEVTPDGIKHGSWCPYCSKHVLHTLKEMQELAAQREGKCLSEKYINIVTKLRWQCVKGHVWKATPNNIIKYSLLCPHCSDQKALKIMQELADQHRGRCLSDKYTNTNTKLKWQCAKNHVWEATPSHIKSGTWCPYCSNTVPLTLEEMKTLATKRNGKCLSNKYVNSHSKLEWQCANNHVWEATPDNIKHNCWCPYCSKHVPLTIKEAQELAIKHKGKCLSKKYIKAIQKLKWQCAEGHIWEATLNGIRNGGHWCPKCSIGIAENLCREIFELIFNKPFSKFKPKWLLNVRGNKMELDGYNVELALAFEYQGEQHYNYFKYFHGKDNAKLIKRKKDDYTKRRLCKINGVKLVEIPYTVKIKDLYKFILNECIKFKTQIPLHREVDIYNLKSNYYTKRLAKLKIIAEEKQGKLLSTTYLGSDVKLKWQCVENHTWEAVPSSIIFGTWCPYCSSNFMLTLQEMHDLAFKRGGKCLSEKYTNSHAKLKWQCVKGHIFEAIPDSIKRGSWCRKCAGLEPSTLQEIQELVAERGGKCLSEKYVNSFTKLKWQCAKGHVWEADPHSIKCGTWCPYCSNHVQLTLKEMQELAAERGGKCLSEKYINALTKLKWQCAKEHVWEAIPSNVKRGSWCPYCANINRQTTLSKNLAK